MSRQGRTAAGHAELTTELRLWLASGELQSPTGAFCAWLDTATGELAFEYPEINGYALTWLAGMSEPTEQEKDASHRAAAWLMDRIEAGIFAARSGWDRDAIYAFDLGMIATGLICHGRSSGDGRAEQIGSHLAERLAEEALSAGGLAPILSDGPRSGRNPAWSNAGGPHLLKCVQCLYLVERDDAAAALLARLPRWERADGFFVTQPNGDLVMLHPHFYAVEGLWIHATARGDHDALELARRATEAGWGHQLTDGALPRYVALNDSGDGPGQCDVTSQAVRAAILTSADAPGLDRAVELLGRVAHPAANGAALPYRASAGDTDLNSWATIFAAQALDAHRRSGAISWQGLV